jgi:hypothetical protein
VPAYLHDASDHRVAHGHFERLPGAIDEGNALDESFALPVEVEEDGVRTDLDDDAFDFVARGPPSLSLGRGALLEQGSEGVLTALVAGAHDQAV